MRTLGQDAAVDLDQTPFWQIGDTLLGIRQRLDEMQAGIRQDANVAAAIGRDLVQLESQYGDAVSRYQQIRVAIGMNPAPGLGAVIIAPALAATIIVLAGTVSIIVASLAYAWGKYQDARTTTGIVDAAHERQRAGDPAGAAAWLALLQEQLQKAGSGLEGWLGKNWPIVAMALGGVVLVTSGKGRR